jgi:hypothetical protein
MKTPRDIVVKTLLNADEFVEFSIHCQAEDVPQLFALRDLMKGWLAERNGSRRQLPGERPGPGQNMAMLLPGRANYGARAHLRMRL